MKEAKTKAPANRARRKKGPAEKPARKPVRRRKTSKDDKGAIIFLDIDGVLNGIETEDGKRIPDFKGSCDERAFGFSPDLVANLRKVLDVTDAKIVVSSSWRHFTEYYMDEITGTRPVRDWRELLAGMLGRKADELFIGSTPALSFYEYMLRGDEIAQWMKDNKDTYGIPGEDYRFCIIDDEVSSILKVFDARNVLHTKQHVGLTASDADTAIHILKYS